MKINKWNRFQVKMRILCVIDSLCFGGAQRQLVELAFSFKAKGHAVSFLTYHHIPFFNSMVEEEGIPIMCIHEPNYIKRLFKMRRFIRMGKFDAILSFLEAANFICEFAGIPNRKWKLVAGERSANPAILKSLKLKIYRWFHFYADYIVANSKANLDLVRTVNPLLPESKCRIIYNTVDFRRFSPAVSFDFRRNGRTSLVIAARIQYEKNIHGLIEALSLLKKEELEKIKIDWYGEYDTHNNTNRLLIDSQAKIMTKGLESTITFHAATHDIIRIIQESDAVGLFSFYEGFPNIICEAMACEKPVVCTRVSDMSYFLSQNPELLCDPTDPVSIRDALSYLISLDSTQLQRIGTENRNIAMERFNREKIVSSYLNLLGAE